MSECVFKKSCDLIDLAKEKNTFQLPPSIKLVEWLGQSTLYMHSHRSPQGSKSCQAGNTKGQDLLARATKAGLMREFILTENGLGPRARVHVLPIRLKDNDLEGVLIGRPYGETRAFCKLLTDAAEAQLSRQYKLVLKNVQPNPHGVTLNRPSYRGRVEGKIQNLQHLQESVGIRSYVWIDELQRGNNY